MKFAVGVMLTSFGMFWGTEGAGGSWPGWRWRDPSPDRGYAGRLTRRLVALLRRRHARLPATASPRRVAGMKLACEHWERSPMTSLIGDDPLIAVGEWSSRWV